MRRSCRRSVPVCASGGGAGCWASASDTVSTVGTARLNAASPRRESALRREITPDAIFSLIANSSLTSTPLTLRTSLHERQLNKPNQKPRTRFPSHSLTPSVALLLTRTATFAARRLPPSGVIRLMSASLIGRLGQALSGYPPRQCRCRSRARASLRTRHQGPPAHIIVADNGQQAAMQDAELLANDSSGNEQRVHPRAGPGSRA